METILDLKVLAFGCGIVWFFGTMWLDHLDKKNGKKRR